MTLGTTHASQYQEARVNAFASMPLSGEPLRSALSAKCRFRVLHSKLSISAEIGYSLKPSAID